jgi:hypothetical protein
VSDMDDIPAEIIEAANEVMADIFMEASYVVAESLHLITFEEAVNQAIINLALGGVPSGTEH